MTTLTDYFSRLLFILISVCAVSIGTAAAQPGGHLVILRSPNFGWNIAVHLQIDGRDVANIVKYRHYDGFVPAGPHVLTVSPVPVTSIYGNAQPTSMPLNVRPGGTYVFTAMWDSSLVFLRPSGVFLTPGAIWQNRGDVY
jgi:hypothetical protein